MRLEDRDAGPDLPTMEQALSPAEADRLREEYEAAMTRRTLAVEQRLAELRNPSPATAQSIPCGKMDVYSVRRQLASAFTGSPLLVIPTDTTPTRHREEDR
jgi:hypothetical protein